MRWTERLWSSEVVIAWLLLCDGHRWMFLDDQNLCIQTSTSFVFGAVPIGASIYVVGDLDTGQYKNQFWWRDGVIRRVKDWALLFVQEQASTSSGSSAAAPGHGFALSLCWTQTFPKRPAPPCVSPTVDCSAFSWGRARSESDSTLALSSCYRSGCKDFLNPTHYDLISVEDCFYPRHIMAFLYNS